MISFKEFCNKMASTDLDKTLKTQRAIHRKKELEARKVSGQPRAKTWDDKKSPKIDRKQTKASLKKMI